MVKLYTAHSISLFKKFLCVALFFGAAKKDMIAQDCSGDVIITKCVGTLDDGSGIEHYGDNLECEYTVTNPLECAIFVTFQSMQVEACCDFVTIYDGPDDNSPVIGVYSGQNIPPPFTTSGSSFHIKFTTDDENNFQGWSVSWNGQRTMSSCTGTISDGSGPNNYQNNQHSWWRIIQPETDSITFVMDEMDTEFKYDYVYVYGGSTTGSEFLGSFNGNTMLQPLTTTNDTMIVVFISDASGTAGGFSGHYSVAEPEFNMCDGEINQVHDTYGHNYQPNENCTWLIDTDNPNLYLHFNEFSLEGPFDYLRIYDGQTTSDPLLGTFSGFDIPADVISGSGDVLLNFVSDGSFQSTGFSLEYSCQPFIHVEKIEAGSLSIFPMPIDNTFNVHNNSDHSIDQLFLTDITGRIIERYNNINLQPAQTIILDSNGHPQGVYHLNYFVGGHFCGQTIVLR